MLILKNFYRYKENSEQLLKIYISLLTIFNCIFLTKQTIFLLNENNNSPVNHFRILNSPSNYHEKNFNCNLKYNSLKISTNIYNSENFNIEIFTNCQINEFWKIHDDSYKSCISRRRVIEGVENKQRIFKFLYIPVDNISEAIVIKSISLDFPKSSQKSYLNLQNFTLIPGDSENIQINYDCSDNSNNEYNSSDNWYNIIFTIEFDDARKISFEYIKVCNASYTNNIDISHFIIISFIFIIIYLSTKEFLRSKLENIIVEKYTEIRNPENILLISIIVIFILYFFFYVNFFEIWISFVISLIAPFSIGLLLEAILKHNDILLNLENRSFEIPFIGSITFFFGFSLFVGYFILFLWYLTHNWVINNIIAISISLISIRLFKFTSFKLLIIMFSLGILYNLVWAVFYSSYYSHNFKLTNNSPNNFPIKILCPEFFPSPFNSCNFLPIADIILPGLLMMFAKIYDENKGKNIYFNSANISLSIGLFVNIMVYYHYRLPLPSFLFTGPIILITVIFIGYQNSELKEILEGFSSTILENNLEKNLKKLSFHNRVNKNSNYKPPQIE